MVQIKSHITEKSGGLVLVNSSPLLPTPMSGTPAAVKQVAQWATIAHHGASIMFGDTRIYDAQRQITLKLKHWPGINSKT